MFIEIQKSPPASSASTSGAYVAPLTLSAASDMTRDGDGDPAVANLSGVYSINSSSCASATHRFPAWSNTSPPGYWRPPMPTAGGTESPSFWFAGVNSITEPLKPVPCTDTHAFPVLSNASYVGVLRSVRGGGPVITNVAVSESAPFESPCAAGLRITLAACCTSKSPPAAEIPVIVGTKPTRSHVPLLTTEYMSCLPGIVVPGFGDVERTVLQAAMATATASTTIGVPAHTRARRGFARLSFITLPIHIGLTVVAGPIVCTTACTRAKAGRSTQCHCTDDGTRYTGGIIKLLGSHRRYPGDKLEMGHESGHSQEAARGGPACYDSSASPGAPGAARIGTLTPRASSDWRSFHRVVSRNTPPNTAGMSVMQSGSRLISCTRYAFAGSSGLT